jgi:hypothetical protein
VGLITPHRIYLTIMKPVREAKARSRAMLCMYVYRTIGLLLSLKERNYFAGVLRVTKFGTEQIRTVECINL